MRTHARGIRMRHVLTPHHIAVALSPDSRSQIEPAPTGHGHVGGDDDDDDDNDDKLWHMCEALQISREVSEKEIVLLIKPHHANL